MVYDAERSGLNNAQTRLFYGTLRRDFRKYFFPIGTSCILYVITSDNKEDGIRSGLSIKWRNQKKHAELNCIAKLENELHNADRQYTVTLYMSWTPCHICVAHIIAFLLHHPNVTLKIFAARIYYHKNPSNREGLQSLVNYPVTLNMMTWRDYQSLWKSYGNGRPISRNVIFQPHPVWGITNWTRELQMILQVKLSPYKNRIEKINKATFLQHFSKDNWEKSTYIVCEMIKQNGDVTINHFFLNNSTHAEIQCISYLRQNIPKDELISVKWYMSWTPCHTCADEIMNFLKEHTNVTLSIQAARVYYHNEPPMRRGLIMLTDNNVAIRIMEWEDYTLFWERFGSNEEEITREEVYAGTPQNFTHTLESILQEGRQG